MNTLIFFIRSLKTVSGHDRKEASFLPLVWPGFKLAAPVRKPLSNRLNPGGPVWHAVMVKGAWLTKVFRHVGSHASQKRICSVTGREHRSIFLLLPIALPDWKWCQTICVILCQNSSVRYRALCHYAMSQGRFCGIIVRLKWQTIVDIVWYLLGQVGFSSWRKIQRLGCILI